MQMILAIALGGAVGAVLRHLMASAVTRAFGTSFPYGTLSVNLLGALVLGLLTGLLTHKLTLPLEMKAFLTVGLLGGFTTFSTFAMEGGLLIERGELNTVFLYMAGSVVLGLGAFFIGLKAARMIAGAGA